LATIAVESRLPLLRMAGITPEAPTEEAALGLNQKVEEVLIGEQEIREAYNIACTARENHVEYVLLGCPHVTRRNSR